MAIFTQYGVEVEITSVQRCDGCTICIVRGAKTPDKQWKRSRPIHELRADGGIEEIKASIAALAD